MKGSKRLVVVMAAILSGMTALVTSADPASGATPAPAVSVIQSTSSKGFAGAGDNVPIGFLVTNTGNTTLQSIAVGDTIDGASVPVTCTQTTLLPQATTTCDASHTTTSGDVTTGSIASSATVSGTDYEPRTVTSSPSSLSVPAVNTSSTPLLPTTFTITTTNTSYPAAYLPYSDSSDQNDSNAAWDIDGTECVATGGTCTSSNTTATCASTSMAPTSAPSGGVKGVMCLGSSNSFISVAVPTSNVEVPVLCAWPEGGFVHVSCGFQAQASEDGVTWGNIGSLVLVNYPVISPPCVTTSFCWAQGNLAIPLNAAVQFVRIQTSGNVTASGNPIEISVEPSARIQANVMVNRIVYQPPGAQSNQTYATSIGQSTETDVSFGQTNSSVSETNTTLGLDANLSVGSSWATLNFDYSGSWQTDNKQTNTQSTNGEQTDTISTDLGSSVSTAPWTNGDNPTSPPWENDRFDLLVNPQFALWDFSSCSSGVASLSGQTTSCPSGSSDQPSTGIVPTAVASDQEVSVADLAPCVQGTGSFTLSGETTPLSQAECDSIVSQDPFAATALGLVPTPAGQVPGQALNPSSVLTTGTPQAFSTITQEAGPTQGYTADESKVGTKSYSASSSMETDLTSVEANSVSVGLSLDVGIPDLFTASAGVKFTYGETNTSGQTLIESYTGTQTFTSSQSFTTSANVGDSNNALITTPYWDPRFDTFMFQSGQSVNSTPEYTPTITGASPVSLALASPLSAKQKVKKVTLTSLPLGLNKGQRLSLPTGQVLTVKKAVQPPTSGGAVTVKVKRAKITMPVSSGSPVGVVGAVLVSGSGFLNGPMGVLACTSSATLPICSSGSNVVVPYASGGSSLYADLPQPAGANPGLVIESQSGDSAGAAFPYFVPYGPPPAITAMTFTGSSSSPTITIDGTGFGLESWLGPPSTPCGGTDTTGSNYGENFYLVDATGWIAGVGPQPICNFLGLHIESYSPTQIVFTYGSSYPDYGSLNSGDGATVHVLGTEFSTTVAYT